MIRLCGSRVMASMFKMLGGALVIVVICAAVALGYASCRVSDDQSRDVLSNHGFTNINLGGVSLFACSEGEASREFTAINSLGKHVSGTVCCGWSGCAKACTVRW